ncbi:uncharacterized protein LOC107265041 isoform X2 [Cephus cinctus]|uniref:MICOS complex subunit MIC13 n=1 Tax=Cephus cinctus TaxID=211228 RepID=A0AAJ7FFN7_CEPCN|nr:uncharacterized protein LOC107265041 isoform X2 [Cephus cinctus]
MGLVRFAVKSTIAGGIVYYTVQEGLWSKPEESTKLYGKLYNNVAPYIKDNIPKEVINDLPQLVSPSDLSNCAKATWNKGVIVSVKYISELPTHVSNGVNALLEQPAMKEALSSVINSNSVQSKPSKAH